jgi:hypothetical protein
MLIFWSIRLVFCTFMGALLLYFYYISEKKEAYWLYIVLDDIWTVGVKGLDF